MTTASTSAKPDKKSLLLRAETDDAIVTRTLQIAKKLEIGDGDIKQLISLSYRIGAADNEVPEIGLTIRPSSRRLLPQQSEDETTITRILRLAGKTRINAGDVKKLILLAYRVGTADYLNQTEVEVVSLVLGDEDGPRLGMEWTRM
ncbi:TPA: hypothetical protein HA291_01295 [Candidatus Micrarchaeota archaeon]|jgi:hypothetical protein|nr:hypothetical protein [Candidatus Micrarchaeota archaeon]HII10297.1 hypothetical protein [Candidatus Micrarchaeota archaeon]